VLAERREFVKDVFKGDRQQDVVDFFDSFCGRARALDIRHKRFSTWGDVEINRPEVTHADLLSIRIGNTSPL
jgi:hypothetical protein